MLLYSYNDGYCRLGKMRTGKRAWTADLLLVSKASSTLEWVYDGSGLTRPTYTYLC